MGKANEVSRLLSTVLRHKPEILKLTLDENGWVPVIDLLTHLKVVKDIDLSLTELEEIVSTNDKKRFALNEDSSMIRASQGHSLNVDLKLKNIKPERILYHGTVEKSMKNIRKTGLQKMNRHAVHLSDNIETAKTVGSRRGDAIILEVQSARMYIDGYHFQKSNNGVWLTKEVPVKYLRINNKPIF